MRIQFKPYTTITMQVEVALIHMYETTHSNNIYTFTDTVWFMLKNAMAFWKQIQHVSALIVDNIIQSSLNQSDLYASALVPRVSSNNFIKYLQWDWKCIYLVCRYIPPFLTELSMAFDSKNISFKEQLLCSTAALHTIALKELRNWLQ